MGAYDSENPKRELELERDQHPWIPPLPMDGGVVVGGGGSGGGGMNDLADRLGGLAVRDVPDDSLIQVMRAVEDAENTIRKQLEENNQLKNELMRKTRELERYRLEAATARPLEFLSDDNTIGPSKNHVSISSSGKKADTSRWLDSSSSVSPQHMLIIHQNGVAEREESSVEANIRNQHYYEPSSNPGSLRKIPGAQSGADSAGPSQFSTPSSRSLSPNKHRKDGELDSRLNLSASGLMPVSENNSNILWKQELIYKVREHEEEIAQLRKHLADYSVKEAQIRNEKYVLEKRIAYMRMAFDQQQQVLVDAASKAISYRQEIIEENIRLTYALEAAQAERSTFVSSLLPLLSEYRLEPAVHDAQSIVRNLKVLFRHMQEKLIFAEEKLKESQYQLAPWHAESSNITRTSPQSPSHPLNAPVAGPSKNSLELVPQTAYQHASSPTSSPANYQIRRDWEVLDNQSQQTGPSSADANNADLSSLVKTSLSASRNITTEEASAPVNQSQPHADRFSFESGDQNPSFKDLVRVNKTDDSETSGTRHERESSMQWAPRNSPYLSSGQDDPSSYHYLPPVLEEPTSSFSEAADDDPLPAIEGLRISGDTYPGRELQASGYSINGTTSCNFEWVRFLEDGSVNYIDGAKQPTYLVTADDVDSYLAIEVQPLDDRKRKGELVKVFANDQRKITCDPEAQEQIKRALSVGHVSYEVSLSARFLDIWEPAILAIKREGYSIKCNGPRGIVATEKFKTATNINIPYGHPIEFLIQDDNGEFLLKTEENGQLRDTIVLTLRLFKMMAAEKRKGKKRGLFFK